MVKVKNGNLLNAEEDILVHQVNVQGVMGGGVARQLADRYKGLENIEEDIEVMANIITHYIEADKCGLSNNDFKCEIQALSNILSDYKRVLKENEELKADNYEWNNMINDLLDNIPVQKVKDKIEELKEEYKEDEEVIEKMAFSLADYIMYYEYDKCRNPEMIKIKANEQIEYFRNKVKGEVIQ